MSSSEIARLRAQIDQEYQASKHGLEGFASGTARHDFLQKRAENIGQCHQQLVELVGPEEAISIIADTIWSPTELGGSRELH